MIEFQKFPKIARLSRDCVITEKIDGTNAQIHITEDDVIYAGSRNRWLWCSEQEEIHNDNYGFARWVKDNKEELMKLGVGSHYGEWWGQGIQRGYNMDRKVFSLFNVKRWNDNTDRPECCSVVPTLYEGIFDTQKIDYTLEGLRLKGSSASPNFMDPEGIVIFHTKRGDLFKKTVKNDEAHKFELTGGKNE